MAVMIKNVVITKEDSTVPVAFKVGETVKITITAVDVTWEVIKEEFTNWNGIKTGLSNWSSVMNYH